MLQFHALCRVHHHIVRQCTAVAPALSITTRSMATKVKEKKKTTVKYQTLASVESMTKDPMAYLYNETLRNLPSTKISKSVRDDGELPYKSIPNTSTKFQLRVRNPDVKGACTKPDQYTLTPLVVTESMWAYDENESSSLVVNRSNKGDGGVEKTDGVDRDDDGKFISPNDVGCTCLIPLISMIAL